MVYLFNPFTGKPRHPSDISSDPPGLLLMEPAAPIKAYTPPEAKMHSNSWTDIVSNLEVGERMYLETSLDAFPQAMRQINVPISRRPLHMKEWKLPTTLFTAVSARKAGDVRYRVCVERTV
jgi:hypothetical protein